MQSSCSYENRVRVGVDFGTTNTIVALADGGNYPILSLRFDYEGEALVSEYVPSAITFYLDRLYFGPAATRCFLDHFEEGAVLIPSLKRLLVHWFEGQKVTAGDVELPVTVLLTGFLAAIRQAILANLDLAETASEAKVEAVIAMPANASSSQRFVTLNCFRQAGFKVLRILDEPTASGIQFVHERYKRWDRVEAEVIIYDLGGGTFDTTLLTINKGAYDPVLSRGINRLGGDDLDELLLTLVEEESGEKFTGRERIEMLGVVRAVKEGIRSHTQKLHVDTRRGLVSISLKKFQEMVEPLLERTIDLVDRVLNEAQGRAVPDRIVLVGGGSLLAVVPRMLRERFGRAKIHQGLYPFASVAIGAAIQAGLPQIEIKDRLHNHFGVIRVREDGGQYVDVIFEKGRPLPGPDEVAAVSRPSYDPRHNIGWFQYLECSDVEPATGLPDDDCVYWNEILFPYDQAINPDGRNPMNLCPGDITWTDHLRFERIQEEYFLDEFGIVTARISRTVQDHFSGSYNLFRRATC